MIVGLVSVGLRQREGHRIAENAGEEMRMSISAGVAVVEYREWIFVGCDANDVSRGEYELLALDFGEPQSL